MIIDEYEILLELIKRDIRDYKNTKNDKAVEFLKKFMLVLDIHVFLKNGDWNNAVDSMF